MPEEDFSSRNVNLRIDAIDTQRASEDCFRVKLSDGSFFYVSYGFYREAGLGCGIEADEELIGRMESETVRLHCYRKALEYALRQESTSFEIIRKLRQKQFDPKVAEKAVAELEKKNLVNDERFARLYIAQCVRRKRESRVEVAAKLAAKGISAPLSRRLIAELYPAEAEEETAAVLAEKAVASGKPAEKTAAALIRKGFPYRIIKNLFISPDESGEFGNGV